MNQKEVYKFSISQGIGIKDCHFFFFTFTPLAKVLRTKQVLQCESQSNLFLQNRFEFGAFFYSQRCKTKNKKMKKKKMINVNNTNEKKSKQENEIPKTTMYNVVPSSLACRFNYIIFWFVIHIK